jgi:hypothetical protein
MPVDNQAAHNPAQEELPDGFFEIRDPQVDLGNIMAQIRQRIQERRRAYGYETRTFPAFGTAAHLGESDDIKFDSTLYHHLRVVNEIYANAETAPNLSPSPATRVPVLGRLWQVIRYQAHSLVLFYVNRDIAWQVNVDRHIISTLNRLAALTQEQQCEITALQAQLVTLQAAERRIAECE